MAFNTGNPVPSTASEDLSDNAENFDSAVNTQADTWQDRLGVTRDTVNGRIKKMGFAAPVTYAGGISFATNDNVKTVDEAGIIYAPLPSALPFTTSGTWGGDDDARFFIVQGLTPEKADERYFLALNSVVDMQSATNSLNAILSIGDKVTTGSTKWVITSATTSTIVPNGLFAELLNDTESEDFGGSDTASVNLAVDASTGSQNINISGVPTYDETVQWKGRRHETSDLPFLLNSAPIASGALNARMQVVDDVLYVCEFANNKIGVFTLEDPRNPRKISEVSTGNSPRHVAVFGKIMAVCCRASDNIIFYDISNLAAIIQVGSITTATGPKMFELRGCELYVVCSEARRLQKYSFSLDNDEAVSGAGVGGFIFNTQLIYSVETCIDPLCCSVNEIGKIVVSGAHPNVYVHGELNGSVTSIKSYGGDDHGFCLWVSSDQFLLADWLNSRVIAIDATDTQNPVILSSVTVVDNPEQITVIGDRFYVPQLEVGVAAYLSAVDMVDRNNMYEYKRVPLSVTAAGFTAYHQAGETGYLYVNGHTAPFNIDVVEVVAGKNKNNTENFTDTIGARVAVITSLNAGHNSIRKSFVTYTVNTTQKALDSVVRIGSTGGALTYTLLDPVSLPNKQLQIRNVGTQNVVVSNAFAGFSGTMSPGAAVTLIATSFGGVTHWEVFGSHGTIT